ncbi:MAG: hypothetical protein U0V70_09905 [Terriglobia bacterium]
MKKVCGIIAMLLVPLVSFGFSQVAASQLSKQEIETLVSELALLKARVSTLEGELRSSQKKAAEVKEQLVYTMVNLGTVTEVVESIRPSAVVSIPRVMFNKESNGWTAAANVSEEIRKQSPKIIVESLFSVMGMAGSGIDDVASTWSGSSELYTFINLTDL